MKNKPEKDFNLIFHINERYLELAENVVNINTFEQFIEAKNIRKSILFYLFQIGELLHHLSSDFVTEFGREEIGLVVGLRNVIVHGYGEVKDDLVYKSIKSQLPSFIERINRLGMTRYLNALTGLIGKKVDVYRLNNTYYTDKITTLSGTLQKVELGNNVRFFNGKTMIVKNVEKRNGDYVVILE